MKLTAKLLLVFLIAVTVLTSAYGFLAVQREKELFELEQRKNANRLASEAKETILFALNEKGHEGAVRIVQETNWHVEPITVRWVRLDATADHPDCPAVPTDRLGGVAAGQAVSFFHRDVNGQDRLHTYVPIDSRGTGALEFSRSLERLDLETGDTILRTLALIALIAVASVLVVLFAGVRMIGRPLEQLIEKTRRTGIGDFSAPLELKQRDELGQLAGALNRMCDQLRQQQRKIESDAAARLTTLEQLRHADRLKTVGRLAAGVAHELGTPLNVVSGRAELIAAEKLSKQEIMESATTIKQQSDRIAAIIRQLLDFARRTTPQRTVTDIRDVIRKTVELVQPLAEKRDVHLLLRDASEPLRASVDVGQMQQVLSNILMNAIQSFPNGGDVTVTAKSVQAAAPDDPEKRQRDFICIEVTDRGRGIRDEDLPHIFEPFFTTKDVGEGTGLGLSVSYGMIEDHGGWIGVTSQLGEGSCFRVHIPQESENA